MNLTCWKRIRGQRHWGSKQDHT